MAGPALHLHGRVYGHPCFHDGESVTTTGLVLFRPDLGVAETLNTVYLLGSDKAEIATEIERMEIPA